MTPINLDPQPRPPVVPSRAVLANNNGKGVVLWCRGTHIEQEIDALDCSLESLGLDNAPEGISIWEGRAHWSPGPWEHPEDGDVELVGTFRAPTEKEWEAIRRNECPWGEQSERLAVCAQEVFEALSIIVHWHDKDGRVDESWWQAARDVIATVGEPDEVETP